MAQSWWSQPAAPVTQTVAVTVWPGRARTLKADSDGGNLRAAAVNRRDGLSPFKEMLVSARSPAPPRPRLEQDARPASRLSITADSTKRLLEFRTFHRAGRSEAESEQAVAGTDSHPAPCPPSPHRYSPARHQTVQPSSGAYAVGDAGAGASRRPMSSPLYPKEATATPAAPCGLRPQMRRQCGRGRAFGPTLAGSAAWNGRLGPT